jgi:hypothetical protein
VFFVQARWSGRNKGVGDGIRYISHREERLPGGKTRELFGVGERYRALRGDEAAISKLLWQDGADVKSPRYFRIKLTVDDGAARGLAALSPMLRERVIRDAVERAFRGAFRGAQGVFVIHEHGGQKRGWGHPHAHVHLSPVLADGRAMRRIPPAQLQAFKERWEREVKRGLERTLERQGRGDRAPGPMRDRNLEPSRGRPGAERREAPASRLERGLQVLERWRARAALREASPLSDDALRLSRKLKRAVRSPGGFAAAEALKALVRSLPGPARTAFQITRMLGRVIR